MITTNIDVSDGLTNGAMGFVSNIIMDTLSQDIKAILVVLTIQMLVKMQGPEASTSTSMQMQFLLHVAKKFSA